MNFYAISVHTSILLEFSICLFVYWFSNSSQKIVPKGLPFSGFDGGHPRVVIRKFSEDPFV